MDQDIKDTLAGAILYTTLLLAIPVALVIVNTDKGLVTRPGKAHFDIEPYRYVGLEEWVDDQIEYTGVGI